MVLRRYKYEARLQKRPPTGEYRAELHFGEFGDSSRSNLQIPVYAIGRDPVYTAPSSIFFNISQGQATSGPRVSVLSGDPDFDLSVEVEPFDTGIPLHVNKVSSAKGRVVFQIAPIGSPKQDVSTTLVFLTNHPVSQRIELPVNFVLNK